MWLFVFFDLPVVEKSDQKKANQFRKELLKDGFTMLQFSVYTRHCGSEESRDVHAKRIRELVPAKGMVSILSVTDKQFGDIIHMWGKKEQPKKQTPMQLEFF
jgi:CRISPR-associated protein Cas2